MCYSAIVVQNAKKLAGKYDAEILIDRYMDLFSRRANGEKLYLGKGLEEAFVKNPKSAKEKQLSKIILKWHESRVELLTSEIAKQTKRLANAEQKLATKPTKKALEDQRISTNKIEKAKRDLERHENPNKYGSSDSRIYPLHYVSIVARGDDGKRVVLPMRYLMRPAGEDESWDRERSGAYNARFDNLMKVQGWRKAIGKRHGIMVVNKFFENVNAGIYRKRKNKLDKEIKSEENLVICFEPKNTDEMFIPVLWDVWRKGSETLVSCALITDEPAPEVAAAGHDRTPIFLTKRASERWIDAFIDSSDKEIEPAERKALIEILNDREHPYYVHEVLGAA